MTRPTITTVQVRARDLTGADIILINGHWTMVYDAYPDEDAYFETFGARPTGAPHDLTRFLGTPPTFNLLTDVARNSGVFASAFDAGYTVLRIAHIETSHAGELDDRFVIARPLDLFSVQVENTAA